MEEYRTMNIKSILWTAILSILCISFTPLRLHADEVITLQRALDIALQKSPVLYDSRNQAAAADARLTQAKSSYFPQLDATAGYGHTWSETAVGSTPGSGNVELDYDSYSAGISIDQYIFDFGQTSARVESSRQNLEASGKNYETSEKSLIRDVKSAYYEVLKYQQLVLVSKENVSLRKQQLAQAQALYNQGLRPKIDVTRAEVEISKAQLQLLNDQFGLRRSIIAFEKLLGGPPVPGAYLLADENQPVQVPPVLDPLIGLAFEARPEIMRITAQIRSAEASMLSAQRSAFPSLSAKGSYANTGNTFPMEDDRWQVGVNLNWPLFTGFRKTGQVAEYKAGVNGLRAQMENLKLSITEEVTRAFLLVQATGEAIKTSEVALRQATENLAIADGRYKTGVSDALERSDAQVLYTESRSSLVQAVYEQYKALAELEFSVGGEL